MLVVFLSWRIPQDTEFRGDASRSIALRTSVVLSVQDTDNAPISEASLVRCTCPVYCTGTMDRNRFIVPPERLLMIIMVRRSIELMTLGISVQRANIEPLIRLYIILLCSCVYQLTLYSSC